MKKIDKTKILSTEYKNWENNLKDTNQNHGKYDSSANKHYIDVVMNLLHVQNGLCAYTEMRLCSEDLINEDIWTEGKYTNRTPQFKGQLDHFDPTLKENKAWLYSNFFLVDSDINTKVKGKKEVDDILKPDTEAYNEETLLEYICDKNIFIANTELPIDVQKRINDMIIKLGINFDPVVDNRRRYIADKIKQIEYKIEDWNSIKIDEFPTALKMCRIQNQ